LTQRCRRTRPLRRAGFHLTELLVAVAIAAGPLLVAVHLSQASASGARFNRDRAAVRMILTELTDRLTVEPLATLRGPERARARAGELLSARGARLPPEVRSRLLAQASGLEDRIRCAIEAPVRGRRSLARLVVWAEPSGAGGGATTGAVRVVRYFRPRG
jgi:hypothetical protein